MTFSEQRTVLKASSPPPMVLSEGIWPSGWIPSVFQSMGRGKRVSVPACVFTGGLHHQLNFCLARASEMRLEEEKLTLEAVELPARVTNLDASLADVDGDDFSHDNVSDVTARLTLGGAPLD